MYVKKPPDVKVQTIMSRIIQLDTNLPYFPPDCQSQLVTSLPDDDIKEILYHAMPNMWEKKMVEQGYIYLDGTIHSMESLRQGLKNQKNRLPKVFSQEIKQEERVQKKETYDAQ